MRIGFPYRNGKSPRLRGCGGWPPYRARRRPARPRGRRPCPAACVPARRPSAGPRRRENPAPARARDGRRARAGSRARRAAASLGPPPCPRPGPARGPAPRTEMPAAGPSSPPAGLSALILGPSCTPALSEHPVAAPESTRSSRLRGPEGGGHSVRAARGPEAGPTPRNAPTLDE